MSNKKYIEIKVDNTLLDFKEDNINLQLTFKNPCSGGFGTILGNSSERSQTLPATKQNDSVFSSWWDIGQDNTTTGPIEKDSEIKVNGLNVFTGKAQMKKVSTLGRPYDMQGDEYSVAFFSSNADWFEQLKNKELGRDLDWTNEAHNYRSANVQAGFVADPTLVNYCYLIAKMKDWAVDPTGATRQKMVDVFSCPPAVFISAVLDKIFNSIGYTVKSSFFANAVNIRYVMPVLFPEKYPQEFSEDYLNVTSISNVTQNLTATTIEGIPTNSQTKTPAIGPNPLLLAAVSVFSTGTATQYTAPYSGYFQVTMSVTIDNISGVSGFGFGVIGNGTTLIQTATFAIDATNNGDVLHHVVFLQLEAGQIFEFTCTFNAAPRTMDITAASFDVIGEANITKDSLIDFRYLFRDWKITDFLKGLTAAFNLCFESDPNLQIVTIEPSDNYILTSRALATSTIENGFHQDTTTDSTPKQDLSKKGQVKNMNQTNETQYYKWKEDGADATAQGLNLNEDVELGGCKYEMPPNRFKPETKQNENPFFSPTVMYYDEDIRSATSEIVPLLPLFWPTDIRDNTNNEGTPENSTEFNPRLLWFGGNRLGDIDGHYFLADTSTGTIISSNAVCPACFFVNYNDSSGLDVSLSFSDRTIQGNLVQGMLRRFYLDHLARLRHGKRVEMFIYWDELDILGLTFQNKVLINKDMYILEEINSFDPIIDSTTKTVLLYDFGAEQEDINAIENTIALGVLSDYSEE